MKLRAAIQSGLISGVPVGLASLWFLVWPFYRDTRMVAISPALGTVLTVLAAIILLVGLIGVGVYCVVLLAEAQMSERQMLWAGGGAGAVAGVVAYLLGGAPGSALGLGLLSYYAPLRLPGELSIDELLQVLGSAVWGTVAGTYLVILIFLVGGFFFGGVGALVYSRIRSWRTQS